MTKMIAMGSLLGAWFVMTTAGCEIRTCEEGAYCPGDGTHTGDAPDREARDLCIQYCARVSVCGGSQADDLDECIDACEDRFEVLPEQTRELCECAPRSSCEDVNDGRCTDPGSGGRGGSSAGGSSNQGGANSSGGSSTQGGAPSTGGSPAGGSSAGGASPGGAPGTGGSSSGGSASCTGGTSSGGTNAGGAGGEGACSCDCDCAEGERCVDGACAE